MGVLQTAALHPQCVINRSSDIFDDFYQYTTLQNGLTSSPLGAGSVALTAAADTVTISSAATDNDASGIITSQAAFLFTVDRAMYAEELFSYTNQSTTNANIAFGFASSATLGIVNGAAPTVACSAIVWKGDGGSVWNLSTSCNGVVTTTASTASAIDGKYLIHLDVFNFDGLNAGVSATVNGAVLRDSNGLAILHKVPYASAVAMFGVTQCKAGSANVQTKVVDYVSFGKNRLLNV